MPNKEAVYLHDTPSRQLFAHDYRFLSHGCVRVQGVDALAAWILGQSGSGREAWTPERLAAAIKTEDTKQLPVKPTIPVAWVYLDAWADSGGTVHFRGDIYHLDEPQQHPADEASR
jgi:murein L,D-transpeptidase YcbB/YkuD